MLQRHDLYFFLYPPAGVAEAAAERWQQMLADLDPALLSRPMATQRLHLTLQHLGQFEGSVPRAVLDLALAAGERLVHEPFDVCLHLLQSRGATHAGSNGTVELAGQGAGVQMLRSFQRSLGGAMRQAGFAEAQIRRRFSPHMTLHYGLGGVRRQAVAPVVWTVSDFALVDSLYGLSRHEVLSRWPLVARQQSFTGW